MGFLIMVASMLSGALGQWFKSHPKYPTPVVVLAMSALGLTFYGLGHGWPLLERESILSWLDEGWVWAFALPGVASVTAAFTPMKTQDAG